MRALMMLAALWAGVVYGEVVPVQWPPASVAWAIATIPDATAAAAPPEEPPGERDGSNGLTAGSDVRAKPNSGTVVSPKGTRPAARNRRKRSLSFPSGFALRLRAVDPAQGGRLPRPEPRSLPKNGTAAKGPDRAFCAPARPNSASIKAKEPCPRAVAAAKAASMTSGAVIAPEEMAADRDVASCKAQAGSLASIGTSKVPAAMAAFFSSIAGMASAGTSSATKINSLPPYFMKEYSV